MRKLTQFAKHIGGVLVPVDHQAGAYEEWISRLKEDQAVRITHEVCRGMKTNPQLGYYHAALLPWATQVLLDNGWDTLPEVLIDDEPVETTEENVDWWFKIKFQRRKRLEQLPSKAEMTDETMSQFIDFIINWYATNIGAEAPMPTLRSY